MKIKVDKNKKSISHDDLKNTDDNKRELVSYETKKKTILSKPKVKKLQEAMEKLNNKKSIKYKGQTPSNLKGQS